MPPIEALLWWPRSGSRRRCSRRRRRSCAADHGPGPHTTQPALHRLFVLCVTDHLALPPSNVRATPYPHRVNGFGLLVVMSTETAVTSVATQPQRLSRRPITRGCAGWTSSWTLARFRRGRLRNRTSAAPSRWRPPIDRPRRPRSPRDDRCDGPAQKAPRDDASDRLSTRSGQILEGPELVVRLRV